MSTLTLTESILDNPVFAGLSQNEAEELAQHCEVLLLPPNRIIFLQDDPSTDIYVLFRGRLEIRVRDTAGEDNSVGYLEQGEVFGEMGVLESVPRSASVFTAEDSVLLKIPGKGFTTMTSQGQPAIHRLLQWSIHKACNRLRNLDARLDGLFTEE